MFARSNSKVVLTFLCLVVALGLATVSEANSLVHTPRDHASLGRMIKKRVPADDSLLGSLIPVAGAAAVNAIDRGRLRVLPWPLGQLIRNVSKFRSWASGKLLTS